MEKDAAGGARAERDRARRIKSNAEESVATSSAITGFEESDRGAAATATTAGRTDVFHRGQGEGRIEVGVPESATSAFASIIMQ